jgi:hypothetical protein
MAIANLAELRASVLSWLDLEEGQAGLTEARLNESVSLAEATMRRTLRAKEGVSVATGTTVTANGVTTIATPTGFLGANRVDLLVDSEYRDLAWLGGKLAWRPEGLIVQPTLSSDLDYRLEYLGAFAALDNDGASNWILESYEDAYLFGTITMAAGFMKSPDAAAYADRFGAILAEVDAATINATWGINQANRDVGGGTP